MRSAGEPTLHVLCGKLASGKTTLARQIAAESDAILFCEDSWLSRLFPVEIVSFADYLSRSARFRRAIAPHVQDLVRRARPFLRSTLHITLEVGRTVLAREVTPD